MSSKRYGRIAAVSTTIAAIAATTVGLTLHQAAPADADIFVPTSQTASIGAQLGADNESAQRVNLTKTTNQIGAVVDADSSMPAFLTASYTDVAQTWTRLFAGWGYQAPTAQPVFPEPGQALKTGCRAATNDTTMEYCALDDSIVFSQQAAYDLWSGRVGSLSKSGTGDMSVALLLAHEYGHNIEAELNRWGGASLAEQAARERGADCFAGVWADDAAKRGLLDDTDVAEAYAALDLAAEHPEHGVSDQGVHGTAAERQQAYEIGATRGASACVDTYLSELSGVPTADQTTSGTVTAPQHHTSTQQPSNGRETESGTEPSTLQVG